MHELQWNELFTTIPNKAQDTTTQDETYEGVTMSLTFEDDNGGWNVLCNDRIVHSSGLVR